MSATPETDVFIRTQLAQVGMNGVKLSAKLTLKCEKLERERNNAIEMMNKTRDNSGQIIASQAAENILLTEQRDRLEEALQSVKCELGVPQPEYPSPVANAYWIADEALQSLTKNMSDTPETDKLAQENHIAHPTVWSFCRKFERERDAARDSLAPSAWTLDWQAGPYPDTMRIVLATDGENIWSATYTKEDGWQDAYSGEPVDYYITYWCEVPELPQL